MKILQYTTFSACAFATMMVSYFAFFTARHGICTNAFVPSPSNKFTYNQRQVQRQRQGHSMFTGIVEEMGTVISMEERDDMTLWDGSKGKGTELVVEGDIVMDGAYLG